METKEFPIEVASLNYIKYHSPNVYLEIFWNHALHTQPRLFSYLVADDWILLRMHWCSEVQRDYYN